MEVRIERTIFSKDFTMSRVYIDNNLFSFSLEPYDCGISKDAPVNDIKELKKKYGKIAIPLGEYKLVIDWSKKYQRMMPHILAVPAFEGVRIHSGNTVNDTKACTLLGKFYRFGQLFESRKTCKEFEDIIKNKDVTIKFTYASEKQFV